MTPKQHLIQLSMERKQINNPNFPYPPKPTYSDKSANGLTKMIIDFINLMGGQAERVSNTGRVVVDKGVKDQIFNRSFASVKWIPGQGTNGTADISSTIPIKVNGKTLGLSVKWEVKIRKDTQKIDQKKYESDIKTASGEYYIVKTFEDFYQKYFDLLKKYD